MTMLIVKSKMDDKANLTSKVAEFIKARPSKDGVVEIKLSEFKELLWPDNVFYLKDFCHDNNWQDAIYDALNELCHLINMWDVDDDLTCHIELWPD